MKLQYYPETDSLSIELRPAPGAAVRKIVDGLNADLDEAGAGFDLERASLRLDRTTLEITSPPLGRGPS